MKLVNDEGDAIICKELSKKNGNALSKERIEIVKILATKEHYAAELARMLGIGAQALYYHMKVLQKAGIVTVTEYEEKQGGIAKKFGVTADAYSIIIKENTWKKFVVPHAEIPALFEPFINEGIFNGKFVVGSPDPHGP